MILAGEKSILDQLEIYLKDVKNLVLSNRNKEAILLAQDIVRTIVRLRVDRACIVSTSLEQDIEELFNERIIDSQTRKDYHKIRELGIDIENGQPVSSQDASLAFSLSRNALDNYISSASGGGRTSNQSSGDLGATYPGQDEIYDEDNISATDMLSSNSRMRDGGNTGNNASEMRRRMANGRYDDNSNVKRNFRGSNYDNTNDSSTPNSSYNSGAGANGANDWPEGGIEIPASRNRNRNAVLNDSQYPRLHVDGTGTNPKQNPSKRDRPNASASNRRPSTGRRSGGRSTSARHRRYSHREAPLEIDLMMILKIAVPVVCIVLMVILFRILTSGEKSEEKESSTKATTETTAESQSPEETSNAPEILTEAPAVPIQQLPDAAAATPAANETAAVSQRWVTTAGVNVRTGPSTDSEKLDALEEDTEVTYKGDAGDWIIIDFNGQDAYINKQYVKPR